ncbi:MAG: hypothetical protein H0T89_36280 [Deltaproteobacteria bacterium]|nr:hypothetical protein [Deltaproteobacteria bacterium]MDQ3298266.1 PKD domain-containing protein [Myxococcota bacterium]
MTSKATLVLVLSIVGCTDDVPTLRVSTTALTSIELSPPDDGVPDTFGHYRWDVSQVPEGVFVAPPAAQTATITVTPLSRGVYVYDRWFVGEATEQLSYHVVVTVAGARPTARVGGPMTVAIGEAATFDGSSSTSTEARIEGYQWRLALRPEASTAMLTNADQATLTFVPDLAGRFKIELRVFDGQLWGAPTIATLTAR